MINIIFLFFIHLILPVTLSVVICYIIYRIMRGKSFFIRYKMAFTTCLVFVGILLWFFISRFFPLLRDVVVLDDCSQSWKENLTHEIISLNEEMQKSSPASKDYKSLKWRYDFDQSRMKTCEHYKKELQK